MIGIFWFLLGVAFGWFLAAVFHIWYYEDFKCYKPPAAIQDFESGLQSDENITRSDSLGDERRAK